ncbi:MAG: fibronectin type III domain-containing protein, partial [Armatimonadota bacterium]
GVTIGAGDPAGTIYNYNVSFNATADSDNAVIRSKVNLDSSVAFGSIHQRVGAHVWVGTAPDASPSGLVAAPGAAGEINLAWVDNTSNELSFILERSTTPSFTTKTKVYGIPANSTSFTDTGLTTGVTYYYKITATNALGTAPLSDAASAIAP